MDQAWFGLPESEHRESTISAFYTPEEAELLVGIPLRGTDLEEIARTKGADPGEIAPKLDALARKGAVWRSVKSGKVRYKLNDAMFTFLRGPFWAREPNPATLATARPLNRYFYDGFMDQFSHARTKGLRTIPIQRTIEDPRRILSYEDVVQYVESQDYCTVSYCPCRQRKNLNPDSPQCDYPLEVCLHFGALGHYIVENDLGREISKEETFDILELAADSGLVHAISNWQQGADTICNCCKCCCLFFDAYHVLHHTKSHDSSNYQVCTSARTCNACGLCVERCPMDALSLQESPEAENRRGMAAVVDLDRCIGCGVCVYKCPTNSLTLKRRKLVSHPPSTPRDWMERWFQDRQRGPGRRE
jgi:formate hydrogenlyase subunit 6/NADH:ubiquinone oxidoreductase subunit I